MVGGLVRRRKQPPQVTARVPVELGERLERRSVEGSGHWFGGPGEREAACQDRIDDGSRPVVEQRDLEALEHRCETGECSRPVDQMGLHRDERRRIDLVDKRAQRTREERLARSRSSLPPTVASVSSNTNTGVVPASARIGTSLPLRASR